MEEDDNTLMKEVHAFMEDLDKVDEMLIELKKRCENLKTFFVDADEMLKKTLK